MSAALLVSGCDASNLAPGEAPQPSGDSVQNQPTGTDETGGDADVAPTIVGRYVVVGDDSRWGSYTGHAEIRSDGEVLHEITYDTLAVEGFVAAQVWQGTWTSPDITVELARAAFITELGSDQRDLEDTTSAVYAGALSHLSGSKFSLTLLPNRGDVSVYTETWTRTGPPAEVPLWQNERQIRPGHDDLDGLAKQALFELYGSYHELPYISPYTEHPAFQAAQHFFIFDPTDYDYYQGHPTHARVIQGVVDRISLTEARIRSLAYGKTLAEKAQVFQLEMSQFHINGAGVYSAYDPDAPEGERFLADHDATLWTGVYAASQAMRYLVEPSSNALEELRRSVDGLIMMFDIAPNPGDFARAVQETRPNPGPRWVRGDAPFDAWDWEPGANNDMYQGYMTGFFWAWSAFEASGGDPRQVKMRSIVEELLAHSPEADDDKSNEIMIRILLALMADNPVDGALQTVEYKALFAANRPWIVDQGNGATWEAGTSDWSGNHLTIQTLLTIYHGAAELGDTETQDAMGDAMNEALSRMAGTRLGLFQLVAATLGDFPAPPPELLDAVWVLREMPAPKPRYTYDYRLNPDWSYSPFPNLPWKNDWTTNFGRTQGVFSHPLFERNVDQFHWRDKPFEYFGTTTNVLDGMGADYLFAYWFGRYYGVLSAAE